MILPSRSSGTRVYIDPTTYNDVEEAVQEFANELEKNWIELSKLIGGGMHRFPFRHSVIFTSFVFFFKFIASIFLGMNCLAVQSKYCFYKHSSL